MPEVKDEKKGGSALAAVLDRKSERIAFDVEEEERLPGSRVRFRLKVTEDALAGRLEETFKEFGRMVRIPGFRPGKAPKNLVRNRFELQAREETVKRMVPRLTELFCEDRGIEILSEPFLIDWKSSKEGGTRVELAIEVSPEIVITDETLTGLSVNAHRIVINDELVEKNIQKLRERGATFEPSDEAAFEPHDGLLFTCTVTDESGAIIAERSVREHYSTDVANDFPKAMADALAGKKKGDHLSLTIEDESEGNTNVHYELDVLQVKKRVLPALDDDFAQDLSEQYKTLDDLRKGVREGLDNNEKNREREEALTAILDVIAERVKFDLPRALVERTAHRSIGDMEKRLNQYGMSLRHLDPTLVNNYAAGVEQQARLNVRNYLLVKEVCKKLDMKASDEDINAALDRLSKQAGRKALAIRAELEKKKEWTSFLQDLAHKMTHDILLDRSSVSYEDITPEQWEAVVEKRRQAQLAAISGQPAEQSFEELAAEIQQNAAAGEATRDGEKPAEG